jgi:Ras homolog enriched in brain
MLVYSVASRQSFDMVAIIRDKILNHLVSMSLFTRAYYIICCYMLNTHKGANWVPLVIVGNKNDLKLEQRQVSLEEGRQLGEEFRCAFTEASARLDYNVVKAFELMIEEIEKSQNSSQLTGSNRCNIM